MRSVIGCEDEQSDQLGDSCRVGVTVSFFSLLGSRIGFPHRRLTARNVALWDRHEGHD